MYAVLEEANQLESLKAGYWGRITTDNPSLRDRLCDQSVQVQELAFLYGGQKIQLTPSDLRKSRKYSYFRNGTGRFSRGQDQTNSKYKGYWGAFPSSSTTQKARGLGYIKKSGLLVKDPH